MPYGKYKGMTFYEIIKKDITYVNWFRRTINKNWDAKLKDMFDMYWEYYHR